MLNVLDLFSGIGGFSLGLERAGMRTVAFCEIEPFCRSVLEKHWPNVPIYEDVRTLTAEGLRTDGIAVDVICGGFPCQDISIAGKGAGIEGERSGLWSEYARIIGEVRPRYVIVENVAALLGRGIDRVLGDLAALGYDAEWHCIPASAVGAPHRRDRVWIVAYPGRNGCQPSRKRRERSNSPRENQGDEDQRKRVWPAATDGRKDVADADESRLERQNGGSLSERARQCSAWASSSLADAHSKSPQRLAISWGECSQWLVEPDVGRVAHGVPSRVDRLRSLGNAVVPQIAEIIGKAIMDSQP